jgi:acyl-CoA reductase-like NAD-dependent aldehyde dehydrogenase
MMFREVKEALKNLLAEQAESRFRVIGFQRQSKSADEVLNNDRLVQIYYSEGEFPKSANRMRGSKTHNLTIEIDLTASAKASVDAAVLDSATATESQKATALAELKEAAEKADDKIDELIDYVYQIIMDARNEKISFETGEITSRWIDRITKDVTIEHGDLVVKTANMKYTCRVQETVLGAIGNYADPVVIKSNVPAFEDEGTGVLVQNSGG